MIVHNITITMDSDSGYNVFVNYEDDGVCKGYGLTLSYNDIEKILLDVILDIKDKNLR